MMVYRGTWMEDQSKFYHPNWVVHMHEVVSLKFVSWDDKYFKDYLQKYCDEQGDEAFRLRYCEPCYHHYAYATWQRWKPTMHRKKQG